MCRKQYKCNLDFLLIQVHAEHESDLYSTNAKIKHISRVKDAQPSSKLNQEANASINWAVKNRKKNRSKYINQPVASQQQLRNEKEKR